LSGWTLETELKCFEDVDTQWFMNDTLTWLSPVGDSAAMLSKTSGHAISEAFWAHTKEQFDAKINTTKRATTAQGSETTVWSTDKSVNGKKDFFDRKK